MITKQDLLEAIAECQGIRNPGANTCIKLAAYYIILDHITESGAGSMEIPAYYGAEQKSYQSGTEFGTVIEGREPEEILAVMDELMSTLQVINPRLYAGVLRRFER